MCSSPPLLLLSLRLRRRGALFALLLCLAALAVDAVVLDRVDLGDEPVEAKQHGCGHQASHQTGSEYSGKPSINYVNKTLNTELWVGSFCMLN